MKNIFIYVYIYTYIVFIIFIYFISILWSAGSTLFISCTCFLVCVYLLWPIHRFHYYVQSSEANKNNSYSNDNCKKITPPLWTLIFYKQRNSGSRDSLDQSGFEFYFCLQKIIYCSFHSSSFIKRISHIFKKLVKEWYSLKVTNMYSPLPAPAAARAITAEDE